MIAGIVCVDGSKRAFSECRACALNGRNPCSFTAELIADIEAAVSPAEELPGYRVSELVSDCPRKVVLQRRHEVYVPLDQLYWLWRGQLAHELVARAREVQAGELVETRLYADVPVNGRRDTVTGKPDAVINPQNRLLRDYKTTARVPGPTYRYTCAECGRVIHEGGKLRSGRTCPACGREYKAKDLSGIAEQLPPRPYGHHEQQLNVYRWLLSRNGVQVDRLEVVYMDMRDVVRVEVTTWDLDEADRFVRERVAALTEAEKKLPPPLDPDETWECRYCHVREICAAL